jgi:hypothetical protein
MPNSSRRSKFSGVTRKTKPLQPSCFAQLLDARCQGKDFPKEAMGHSSQAAGSVPTSLPRFQRGYHIPAAPQVGAELILHWCRVILWLMSRQIKAERKTVMEERRWAASEGFTASFHSDCSPKVRVNKSQNHKASQKDNYRHNEKSAAPQRLLTAAAQPIFTGVFAAIAAFAVPAHVSCQTLALVASRRIIIFGGLRPPPARSRSFGQRRPTNAVRAAITGGDAGFTSKAVNFAVFGAEQLAAGETTLDCLAATDVTGHGHIATMIGVR